MDLAVRVQTWRFTVADYHRMAEVGILRADERVELIRAATAGNNCVEVTQFEGLLVDFARKVGAKFNIRGLRAVSDFEYEFQMALMNRHMSESFETIFMVPSVETTYISSSVVREVAQHHGNLEGLVHPAVAKALSRKFQSGSARPKR